MERRPSSPPPPTLFAKGVGLTPLRLDFQRRPASPDLPLDCVPLPRITRIGRNPTVAGSDESRHIARCRRCCRTLELTLVQLHPNPPRRWLADAALVAACPVAGPPVSPGGTVWVTVSLPDAALAGSLVGVYDGEQARFGIARLGPDGRAVAPVPLPPTADRRRLLAAPVALADLEAADVLAVAPSMVDAWARPEEREAWRAWGRAVGLVDPAASVALRRDIEKLISAG